MLVKRVMIQVRGLGKRSPQMRMRQIPSLASRAATPNQRVEPKYSSVARKELWTDQFLPASMGLRALSNGINAPPQPLRKPQTNGPAAGVQKWRE